MNDVAPPEDFALDSVPTGLLDCIQVNLAVLADHLHGPGTHLRLGAPLRFAWRPLPDGLPTVDRRWTSNWSGAPPCWAFGSYDGKGPAATSCSPP